MESVITKLSEIEIAAERIMDQAQQQKKELESEMRPQTGWKSCAATFRLRWRKNLTS